MKNHCTASVAATLLAAAIVGTAVADSTTTVTFDNGREGWTGVGTVEAAGGNPGANLAVFNPDTFGLVYANSTGPWADDFSQYDSITISSDVLVNSITFFGQPVTREWIVEIRDFDNVPPGYGWVSVWVNAGTLQAGPDYMTHSVTIDDPTSVELPAGWGGTGAEDPNTFEPILPANRTFADVLAGADEVVLTTFEPGFFYGFTAFDMRIDNISITTTGGGGSGIPGDTDGDGDVDFDDIVAVISDWGPCAGCPGDVDGSEVIDFDDLLLVLSNWTD